MENGDWVKKAKLTADDGAAYDYFGRSVAISGNIVIVGANWDDDKSTNSGSAYVFGLENEDWTQQAKLTAEDGGIYNYFGFSVAIDGNIAIIGAYGDNDKGGLSGSAYIFEMENGSWTQTAKLTAEDGAANDWFGYSVAIDGNVAVVGAWKDDNQEVTDSGSAYVFVMENGDWVQKAKLTDDDGAASDFFGCSVAASGNVAVVGAYNSTDGGSAFVLDWNRPTTSADICTCVYKNGKLPSTELMPAYATPSLPIFTLTSSIGMVLGLRPNIECDSATELTIETQLSDPSNPRQQFEVTRDGRIVSVACPAKVMTTVLALDGLCDSGIALSISTANFETNDESLLQQWTVNSEQGVITNAKCPNLAISSNKEKDVHMNSIYFALQNPRTQLAIGITGTLDDTCTNGMALEMQDMMYGAPNQQFIYDEADLTIANLMCPGYFISIQDGDCSGVDGLYLSSDEYTDKRNKWAFDGNVIQSIKCQDKFITISGALGGEDESSRFDFQEDNVFPHQTT
jgi:hypothetical protein